MQGVDIKQNFFLLEMGGIEDILGRDMWFDLETLYRCEFKPMIVFLFSSSLSILNLLIDEY